MKKLKYLIIGLSIIVIILIAIVLKIVIAKQIEYREQELDQGDRIVLREAGSAVNDPTIYYTVENCVRKYLEYCGMQIETDDNDDIGSRYDKVNMAQVLGITSEQEKNQVIYDLLEKKYIEDNNISVNNVNEFIAKVSDNINFKALHMREAQGENLSKYIVYVKIKDKNNNKEQYIYIIVNIDTKNNSFSIHPIKEENEVNEVLLAKDIEEIARNDQNIFTYVRMNTQDIIRKYVDDYKDKILNDLEGAYKNIDESYRTARFGSLEAFKIYVENNKQELMKIVPAKYKIDQTDDYTQYTILTPDEDYYIFRETAVMEYSVILDTYSIDLPEFLEKYNKATEQEKVAMNISKFVEAINKKDYQYAYSKLADSFKNNYFKTQASFEQYIKTQYYNKNQITFGGFNNQANTYTYTTTITNKETKQTKNQNFVVRLKEGTDFEMSFEVK